MITQFSSGGLSLLNMFLTVDLSCHLVTIADPLALEDQAIRITMLDLPERKYNRLVALNFYNSI